MNPVGGAEQFRQLSAEDQARYIAINRQMTGFARDHAVPLIFAPPLSIGGKINGATGCVVRAGANTLIVTASHVLGGYEERIRAGERLNWQVGNLPPFDPIPRIARRDQSRDVVFLRITDDEARYRPLYHFSSRKVAPTGAADRTTGARRRISEGAAGGKALGWMDRSGALLRSLQGDSRRRGLLQVLD